MMTRILLFLATCLSLACPAWADLTFGVVPAKSSLVQSRQQAEKLARYIQTSLGEPVNLRVFNSESLLHQWMNRYREVDIAILSTRFLDSRPRIDFSRLVDYQPTAGSLVVPGSMAGRRGLPVSRIQQLKDLLMVMDTDQRAQSILQSMHVSSFGTPGAMITLAHPTAPPHRKPAAEIVRPVKPIPLAKVEAPAVVKAAKPARLKKPAKPVLRSDKIEPKIAAAPIPPSASVVQKQAAVAVVLDQAQPLPPKAEPATRVVATEQVTDRPRATEKLQASGTVKLYSRQTQHATSGSLAGDAKGRHYLLLIVAVLLSGLLAKLILLYQRRPRRRPVSSSPQLLIQHDWSELHGNRAIELPPQEKTPAPQLRPVPVAPRKKPVVTVQKDAPAAKATKKTLPVGLPSGQLQLDGKLGPRQIPALLQLISASKQSGTLQVLSKHNKKRLTFSSGRITTVSSMNLDNHNQTGFLMNKLGYLLIREGKIRETQRDQALVMCEGDPNLRMGEALIKMGALKKKDLLESLRYQAKMVLHSLIVFPEGVFDFTPDEINIKPGDNLNLGVDAFLKEAAAHRNEWRNIRQMIPSLDTVLGFAPDGQDKVDSGRMTVHQKFVLSLIDGKRPIREICVAATMLDYELYRFLYLMTKAKILCLAPPRQAQIGGGAT